LFLLRERDNGHQVIGRSDRAKAARRRFYFTRPSAGAMPTLQLREPETLILTCTIKALIS
jgi:hypothetical protein